jgi:hypothetical protein
LGSRQKSRRRIRVHKRRQFRENQSLVTPLFLAACNGRNYLAQLLEMEKSAKLEYAFKKP